jgi:hypothetical protein
MKYEPNGPGNGPGDKLYTGWPQTPLSLAANKEDYGMVKILLENSFNPSKRNIDITIHPEFLSSTAAKGCVQIWSEFY